MSTQQVITSLTKKVGSTYQDPSSYIQYPIGADIKYISSIVNSNNNNLEEEIILDTDRDSFILQDVYNSDDTIDKPFLKEVSINHYRVNNTGDHYLTVHLIKKDKKISYDSTVGKLTVISEPDIHRDLTNLYYVVGDNLTWVSAKEITHTYSSKTAQHPYEIDEVAVIYTSEDQVPAELRAIDPIALEAANPKQMPIWPPQQFQPAAVYSIGDIVQYGSVPNRHAYKANTDKEAGIAFIDANWDDLGIF